MTRLRGPVDCRQRAPLEACSGGFWCRGTLQPKMPFPAWKRQNCRQDGPRSTHSLLVRSTHAADATSPSQHRLGSRKAHRQSCSFSRACARAIFHQTVAARVQGRTDRCPSEGNGIPWSWLACVDAQQPGQDADIRLVLLRVLNVEILIDIGLDGFNLLHEVAGHS